MYLVHVSMMSNSVDMYNICVYSYVSYVGTYLDFNIGYLWILVLGLLQELQDLYIWQYFGYFYYIVFRVQKLGLIRGSHNIQK